MCWVLFITMNIRKIIKEEVNDFDWTNNIPAINLSGDWVIQHSESDSVEIQEWLFGQGFSWNFGGDSWGTEVTGAHRGGYLFSVDTGVFDGYGHMNPTLEQLIEVGTLYQWDDIKRVINK